MRRQVPIAQLLYNYLYPHPSANDPASFSVHLARNLVPEVRVEVATFYGDLNSAEARYPGLNYCHPPHRMRLGRFKHHRRLFEAFDSLGLTYNEIQDFCCWEGTRWARERYEKDEGVKVIDTTGDEIGPFVDRRELSYHASANSEEDDDDDDGRRCSITRKTDISVIVEDADLPLASAPSSSAQLTAEAPQQILEAQDEEMSDAGEEPSNAPMMDENPTSNDNNTNNSDNSNNNNSYNPPNEDTDEFLSRMRAQLRVADEQRLRRQQHRHSREPMPSHWLLSAWNQGQQLPPEVEQFIKEQTERGISFSEVDLAHLNRNLLSMRRNAEASSATVARTPRTPTASA